jgi:hypothetical protein
MRGWNALLHISVLPCLRCRRRVEANASSSVLPFRHIRAASEAAGSAANGLSDVPLPLLRKPEEDGGGACTDGQHIGVIEWICENPPPPTATSTATTMMAASPPLDSVNALLELPAAPASSGSCGTSSPPLYPWLGVRCGCCADWVAEAAREVASCATTRRGRRKESKIDLNIVVVAAAYL